MVALGLKTKKSVKHAPVDDVTSTDNHADDAEAFLKQMEKKRQAAPDQCMFC